LSVSDQLTISDEPTNRPEYHQGPQYYDFMSALSQKRGTVRYLEVGVNEGRLLSMIYSKVAVGVDPNFILSHNVTMNKECTTLISATSDRFFSSCEPLRVLGGSPDLVFLDGLHAFEFLLRDFMNSEAISSSASLIVMHDCLPLDDIMTTRSIEDWQSLTMGTKYQGYWTGDVWKLIPILRTFRPDLRITFVDCPPTGLVCISNLDPSSTVLRENYFKIIDTFGPIVSSPSEIDKLYSSIHLVSGHTVLKEYDHSLYFSL